MFVDIAAWLLRQHAHQYTIFGSPIEIDFPMPIKIFLVLEMVHSRDKKIQYTVVAKQTKTTLFC